MIRTETSCVEVHLHSKGTLNFGVRSLRELNHVVVSSWFVFVDKDWLRGLEKNSREGKRKKAVINFLAPLKCSKRGKKLSTLYNVAIFSILLYADTVQ